MPKAGSCDLCADGVVHKDVRRQQAPLHGQQVGSGTGAWLTLCTTHYFIAARHSVAKRTGEWWERLKSQPTRWRDTLVQSEASGIMVPDSEWEALAAADGVEYTQVWLV